MSKIIGEKVRAHRSAEGMSPEAVAAQAPVPIESIMAFEEGREQVTAAELERIARVLSIHPIALREGRIEHVPTASIFFRQGAFPDFREDQDRPKLAAAFERALALRGVNALLGHRAGLRDQFAVEQPTPEPVKDGYRLAGRVRAELGNESDPLPNMFILLEEGFDILVRTEALASARIDALSRKETQTGAAAVILNAASARRANPLAARVDLAHELGHVLFDPASGEVHLVTGISSTPTWWFRFKERMV